MLKGLREPFPPFQFLKAVSRWWRYLIHPNPADIREDMSDKASCSQCECKTDACPPCPPCGTTGLLSTHPGWHLRENFACNAGTLPLITVLVRLCRARLSASASGVDVLFFWPRGRVNELIAFHSEEGNVPQAKTSEVNVQFSLPWK